MKHLKQHCSSCTLSDEGENRLLRVALASEFLADALSDKGGSGVSTVSTEGVAAMFACFAELLDGVVKETSTLQGGHHDQ
jgi:hypothetical protein